MWNRTAVAERLGVNYPIIQGPFGGGLSSTIQTAAVSSAGGLGSYGADWLDEGAIHDVVGKLRILTSQPYAINLWIPKGETDPPSIPAFDQSLSRLDPYYQELGLARPDYPERFGQDYETQVKAVLDTKPPVFSFVFGVPRASILEACRERGIKTMGTATTPDEAVALDRAGVDVIVASGFEAGGHKGAFLKPAEASLTGLFALIPQIVDRVSAPVVAAGGIADGRGVKAALALGAQGVQIGTAFLACEESNASPTYRELLFSPASEETILTSVFTGRLARSLRNRYADEMKDHAGDLPSYPAQAWLTGSLKTAAIAQNRADLIPLWAGQAAPLLRHTRSRALFDELVAQCSAGEPPLPVSAR